MWGTAVKALKLKSFGRFGCVGSCSQGSGVSKCACAKRVVQIEVLLHRFAVASVSAHAQKSEVSLCRGWA